MNSIIFNYLIRNFLSKVFIAILVTYSFSLILNLFEEIEFFKESDADILQPLILSSIFILNGVVPFSSLLEVKGFKIYHKFHSFCYLSNI